MLHPIPFTILSALAIASALGVLAVRNPIYAVLSLVSTLFAISGIFILLHAYFVAAIQVLVYAGAILILFLFVVMLLDMAPETVSRTKGSIFRLTGGLVGFFFLSQLAMAAGLCVVAGSARPSRAAAGTTAEIGKLLFTRYALPFEGASLLLLAGIIGATVLAKKKI